MNIKSITYKVKKTETIFFYDTINGKLYEYIKANDMFDFNPMIIDQNKEETEFQVRAILFNNDKVQILEIQY